MNTYQIVLSDAEHKALGVVAVDQAEWIQNIASERARIAGEEIYRSEVDRLIAGGLTIPNSKDEIILQAPVESAVERNARLEAEDEMNGIGEPISP
jgi:hypothetical protein